MRKSRLETARPEIVRFFDHLPAKVHRISDIERYLDQERSNWRAPAYTNTSALVRLLTDAGRLSEVVFAFPKPYKREVRYVWGEVSLYEVALALKANSYFSHYTAVKFHGLTEQVPKTTYLNAEQPNASVTTGPLSQAAIDTAFRRRARVSSNVAETKDFRVCVISGKNTGNLGVIEKAVVPEAGPLRFTNLERTLIDVAVRPVYAGGVFEVRKAYELAKDRASVEKLVTMLRKLAYTYPYHQAIGYYLERADYDPEQVELLHQLPMGFDFYLTHQMSQTDYVKKWRLFVPKGF